MICITIAFELELVLNSLICNIIDQPQCYAKFMLNPKPDGIHLGIVQKVLSVVQCMPTFSFGAVLLRYYSFHRLGLCWGLVCFLS